MTEAHAGYPEFVYESRPALVNEVQAVLAILRRHLRLILLLLPLGLVAGYAASYLMTPMYEAVSQVSLDPRRVAIAQPVNAQTQRRDEPLIDSGRADTEVETMRSETVIRAVVLSLDLQNQPEFNAPPTGLRALIRSFVSGPPQAPSDEDRIRATMAAVSGNLKVERVAESYSFTITYLARNPLLAAQVANAIADAYIKQQLDAEYDATSQAVAWLKARTDDLSKETLEADVAASEYQSQAGIARSDGKLIDEKRLETLSEQLTDAQAHRAEAQARYERVKQFSASSPEELAVSDAFQNTVISGLRTQYLELRTKADGLAARYGEDHTAVKKLRGDAKAVEDSIRRELLRYQESYRNEYDVAAARESELKQNLDDQFGKASTVSEAQVKLNALEADARALRAAYDGFMQRYTEALQRQSFPVSEARVISTAVASSAPAKPKRKLLAMGGLFLGLMAGVGTAFAMELAQRRIRTRAEAEEAAGVECFGYVPRIEPGHRGSGEILPAGRTMPLDYVIRNPHTIATETLRTMKTTVDQRFAGVRCPVLAAVSCVPDEGKTSISANLAFLFARKGRRVLLIDGDIRNPSMSNALAGALDQSAGGPSIVDVGGLAVVTDPKLPFHFVPAQTTPRDEFRAYKQLARSKDGYAAPTSLEADGFREMIEAARPHYDYILIDLPPIVPLADVRAVSQSIDAFTLVMAWGKSQANIVGDALASVPGMPQKLIGSILNMAEIKSLTRYGEHVAEYYNSKYFSH